MNQHVPSPEDADLDGESLKIEQQLKGLQPRPPSFDAAAVLKAAGESNELVSRAGRSRDVSHRSWRQLATIGVSLVCGAMAGSLMTLFVLSPRPNDVARHEPAAVQPDSDSLRWSEGEWLVTARFGRLDRPLLAEQQPLTMRSLRLQTSQASVAPPKDPSPASPVTASPVTASPRTENSLPSPRDESTRLRQPTPTRNQLLEELLGDSPARSL